MQSNLGSLLIETSRVLKTWKVLLVVIFQFLISKSHAQNFSLDSGKVIVAAERTGEYVSYLKGKNVALVVNQTSVIHKTHLLDSLLHLGISVKKIFAPEHGFRGNADAAEKFSD